MKHHCDGWAERPHNTNRPVGVVCRPNGEDLVLCPCCLRDFLNDSRVPFKERSEVRESTLAAVSVFYIRDDCGPEGNLEDLL